MANDELELTAGSVQYVYVDVTRTDGGTITTQAVTMALTPQGGSAKTFEAAAWVGTSGLPTRTARLLWTVPAALGLYDVHARIVDGSETLILRAGTVRVTA